MSIIQTILSKIDEFAENENYNYFIVEPTGYPCFLQFAKVGENFLLDMPSSNFFEEEMTRELHHLMENKFRKKIKIIKEDEGDRVMSFQVRFSANEVNKMCYVTKDVFTTILMIEEDSEVGIVMR